MEGFYTMYLFSTAKKKKCGVKLSLAFMGVNYIHLWIDTKSIIILLH